MPVFHLGLEEILRGKWDPAWKKYRYLTLQGIFSKRRCPCWPQTTSGFPCVWPCALRILSVNFTIISAGKEHTVMAANSNELGAWSNYSVLSCSVTEHLLCALRCPNYFVNICINEVDTRVSPFYKWADRQLAPKRIKRVEVTRGGGWGEEGSYRLFLAWLVGEY